ncbi:predicted protein [Verticillium alfalfae VaMs.102]|uniref:Predicted protein n=1 Tax=Verticillium alfalfae (strain VaMs.102 / ATCC MYA-4576 / FGSC 10136) TaxID=526221 RepID=C9SB25_VERA1|nr:predicted protein [Verticillium alfalfae VaMs.102]EEY15575.1 predicted protein [Verticillium alfalfae VaMs.102]
MYAIRLMHLLLATLGFIAVAQAVPPNVEGPNQNAVVRRQDTGNSPSVAPEASTPVVPSASPSTAAQQTTTSAAETTTTPAATSSSPATTAPSTTPATSTPATSANGGGADTTSTPAPSASPSSGQSAPTSSAQDNNNNNGNNNNDNTTNGSDNETTTAADAQTTAEPVTSTVKTVFVTTNAQGETTSMTSESVVVSTPGLSDNDNNGGSGGGMPTKTRNIVIGVVVGVGGAIILGALAFVGFRIHNRKKRQEENDGLMDYNTAGTSAFNSEPKSDAMSGTTANNNNRSPFQTNLESYHQPTQVNASSNF